MGSTISAHHLIANAPDRAGSQVQPPAHQGQLTACQLTLCCTRGFSCSGLYLVSATCCKVARLATSCTVIDLLTAWKSAQGNVKRAATGLTSCLEGLADKRVHEHLLPDLCKLPGMSARLDGKVVELRNMAPSASSDGEVAGRSLAQQSSYAAARGEARPFLFLLAPIINRFESDL